MSTETQTATYYKLYIHTDGREIQVGIHDTLKAAHRDASQNFTDYIYSIEAV